MIHLSTSLKYYKREDVQKALVEHGKDKEVAARFNEQFGKRPDALTYPSDVLELAKQGATSFHCSEELWTNLWLLTPQMSKKDLNKLRKGWDLILDIDCDVKDKSLDYQKIAADLIVKELRRHGVTSVTTKFSGNKGFHIAVPYEAFPNEVNGKNIKELFPEAPKKIAFYIKERIKKELGMRIRELHGGNFKAVAEKVGKNVNEILLKNEEEQAEQVKARTQPELNAEPFLVIDTLLISSRHMYRMPYSLHEKSGLVSVPIDSDTIMNFSKEDAIPDNVKVNQHKFIDRSAAILGEAKLLFTQADDFGKYHTTGFKSMETDSKSRSYEASEDVTGKIPPKFFPPCIRKMLEGVEDGRKRALFVLINFLGSCHYGNEEIEAVIKEWNARNKEPLPQLYLQSQLSYAKQKAEKILPPNCSNASYYKELGIECTVECGRCKNPVAEAKQLYRRAIKVAAPREQPKKRKRKKEDSNL